MKAKKEGRELPEVTVNQFAEGKGGKTSHFACSLDLLWGSTDARVTDYFCPVFKLKCIPDPNT